MPVTGWDLYSTLTEQAQYAEYYKSQPPVACPHDGTPLTQGNTEGVLHCPMGDFLYPRDYDPDTMSGM